MTKKPCDKPEPHGIEYADGECVWCIKEERDRLRTITQHPATTLTRYDPNYAECMMEPLPDGDFVRFDAAHEVEKQRDAALALAYIGDHHFPDLSWKARAAELIADLDNARAVLRSIEFIEPPSEKACPCCLRYPDHAPGCALALALSGAVKRPVRMRFKLDKDGTDDGHYWDPSELEQMRQLRAKLLTLGYDIDLHSLYRAWGRMSTDHYCASWMDGDCMDCRGETPRHVVLDYLEPDA